MDISSEKCIQYYTLDDICGILHIGKTTAYKMVNYGQLPAIKINRLWLIERSELEKYLRLQAEKRK